MRMVPLMKGSSWSSWRKITRPFASSIRLGWTGLNAWSGGIGMCFHGCAAAAGFAGVGGAAGVVWGRLIFVRVGNRTIARRIVEGLFISHLRRSALQVL